MLDKFRTQKIIWDKANNEIFEKVEAHSGDSNGRKLTVQVLNNGMIESLTDCTLSLAWQTKDMEHFGLDAFTAVDIEHGLFEIYYTRGMLSNVGELKASFVLMDGKGRIESKGFTIEVLKSNVDDDAVQSDNSFTALTEALIKVSRYQDQIDDIKEDIINQGDTLISTEQEKLDNLYTEKESKLDTLHQDKLNALNSLHNTEKAELDALEQDYADKATNLETTYAPRLTAVENMEIGGRNLLRNSDFFQGLEPWFIGKGVGIDGEIEIVTLENGNTAVKMSLTSSTTTHDLSLKQSINIPGKQDCAYSLNVIEIEGNLNFSIRIQVRDDKGSIYSIESKPLDIGNSFGDITIPEDRVAKEFWLMMRPKNIGDTGYIVVELVKLEKGNKATDWTPAPEDIQNKFDEYSIDVQNRFDEYSINIQNKFDEYSINIQNKFDEYSINVKDYGAKGDGVTDDTQAIQNAINSITGGGTIFFPQGVYLIDKTLTFDCQGIHFAGVGKSSKLKAGANLTTGAILQSLADSRTNATYLDDVTIEKLGFDCSSKAISGIKLTGLTRGCGIYNCGFKQFGNSAIEIAGSWSFTIQDCNILGENKTGTGIKLGESSTGSYNGDSVVNKATIIGNTIRGCDTGIISNYGYGNTIMSNTIELNTKDILSQFSKKLSIMDNYLEASTSRSIEVGGSSAPIENILIQGNYFYSDTIKIYCYGMINSRIQGNFFGGSGKQIYATTGSSARIHGNYIEVTSDGDIGNYAEVTDTDNLKFFQSTAKFNK